ncbi:hypothetical protein [Flavobacterium sp. ACAM 123]|uniref:hypothetical protein n=1 Tax=Flavobacterium sp. ACAM 123 TaxID=1189620 RepID=UPI001E4F443D|nr:hypothetical protein [Flavobacterium sp. ACAM 123]
MKKLTNKTPRFELTGSSYFRVIYQFLDFTFLAINYLNKKIEVSRFMECTESFRLFLLSRRKIISVLLFFIVLFIATSSFAASSLAVFIITSFTFSWTLFMSSSKK